MSDYTGIQCGTCGKFIWPKCGDPDPHEEVEGRQFAAYEMFKGRRIALESDGGWVVREAMQRAPYVAHKAGVIVAFGRGTPPEEISTSEELDGMAWIVVARISSDGLID